MADNASSVIEIVNRVVDEKLSRLFRQGELYSLSEDETEATALVETKWGDSGRPVGYELVTGPYTHPRLGADNVIWSRPTVRGYVPDANGELVPNPHKRGESVIAIQSPRMSRPLIVTGLTLLPDNENPAAELLASVNPNDGLVRGDPRPATIMAMRELPTGDENEYLSDILLAVLGETGDKTTLRLHPGAILTRNPQPKRTEVKEVVRLRQTSDISVRARAEDIETPLGQPNTTQIAWSDLDGAGIDQIRQDPFIFDFPAIGNLELAPKPTLLQSNFWDGALSDLDVSPGSFILWQDEVAQPFTMAIKDYRITVPHGTRSITLTPTVNSGSSYDVRYSLSRSDDIIEGASGTATSIPLPNGRRIIYIRTWRNNRVAHRYTLQVQGG